MRQLRQHVVRFWLAYVTLVTGLLASYYFARVTGAQIYNRQAVEFTQATAHFRYAMELHFSCYYNILNSLAAFYTRTNLPGNQEFHDFIIVQDITSKDVNLGMLDMGYYARFNAFERQQLLAVLESNNISAGNRERLAQTTDSDWVLTHWDDFKTNSLIAAGSHTVTDSSRLDAMHKCAVNNAVACTEKLEIYLGDGNALTNGFLFMAPVFRSPQVPKTSEDRQKAVKGFVFASFEANDFWKRIYASAGEPNVRFEVFDGREALPAKRWFDSLDNGKPQGIDSHSTPKFQVTHKLGAARRDWLFRYSTLPQFENPAQTRIPYLIFIGGSLTTIVFFSMIRRQLTAYWRNHLLLQELDIANKATAKEKALFHVTFQAIGDGVFTLDINGLVVLMNPAAQKISGASLQESIGLSLDKVAIVSALDPGESFQYPLDEIRQTGAAWQSTTPLRIRSKNGVFLPVSVTVSPMRDEKDKIVGFVAVFRDITEKQKLVEQQIKASKLESIGHLAGGIAHDFNNLLTAILGNISLTRVELKNSGPCEPLLHDAEDACDHAKKLALQLLAFSKGGAPIRKTIAIGEILTASIQFSIQGSPCRCECNVDSDVWPVEIDGIQIGQAFQNMLINAVEAMPHGGLIEIKSCNHVMPQQNIHALQPGRYVKISIIDHGVGIPPEQIDKIFDPYFSTKGHGSGLGLATAYFIIKRHGGSLAVESSIGMGTRFDIYLPASETPAALKSPETGITSAAKPAGRMLILLMDDDAAVINASSKMLKRLGHDVIQANEGATAIEIYKDHLSRNVKIDAVILDLIIAGGMGGAQAIQELLKIDPNVKAIVSSGYSNDPVMSECQKYGFKTTVPKPYTMANLVDALARLE